MDGCQEQTGTPLLGIFALMCRKQKDRFCPSTDRVRQKLQHILLEDNLFVSVTLNRRLVAFYAID